MEQIKYIGMHEIEEKDIDSVMRISEEHFGRLQRYVSNISSMIVHIKVHSKSKIGRRYTVRAKAIAANNVFTASHDDSRAEDAVRRCFKKLEREIKHKFRKG